MSVLPVIFAVPPTVIVTFAGISAPTLLPVMVPPYILNTSVPEIPSTPFLFPVMVPPYMVNVAVSVLE